MQKKSISGNRNRHNAAGGDKNRHGEGTVSWRYCRNMLNNGKNYASIINKKSAYRHRRGGIRNGRRQLYFCKIARGVIPSTTVYEDEDFRVILDLGPASKGHSLILPKKHFANVCELDKETAAKVLPLGAKIGAAMKKD